MYQQAHSPIRAAVTGACWEAVSANLLGAAFRDGPRAPSRSSSP